jgi:urease accessory protein
MITTMTMLTGKTMSENSTILFRVMTWLSPAFPVGAFSYSHGLEWAAQSGLVRDEATLEDWIRTGLAHEFGPVNGMLLRQAWEAVQSGNSAALLEALTEARALVATSEFALETTAQGTAFFSTLRKASDAFPKMAWAETLAGVTPGPLPYSFAVGVALAAAGVPLDLALTAYFQAMIGNLVSAAMRLLPIGQTAGQRVIARLETAVVAAARDAMCREPGDVGTAAPLMELSSIFHETQYTRLFRS